jgi:hypothetical protein
MGTCRICQQEYSQHQQFCSNCGYPLTTLSPTLGELPQPWQEIVAQREAWEQQIWQRYQQLQQQCQQQQPIAERQQENARIQRQLESQKQLQQSQQKLLQQLLELIQENSLRQSSTNSQAYQQVQQQVAQLQQAIANLQQEVTKLTQTSKFSSPSQSQIQEVPLNSSIGYDYTRLRDLLAAGKWKQADKETRKALIKVAGKKNQSSLAAKEVDGLSCEDLLTIDSLWVKYSNGKFGFSIQKNIYLNLGGTRDLNVGLALETWQQFANAVGWHMGKEWLGKGSVSPNPDGMDVELKDIPAGHFPQDALTYRYMLRNLFVRIEFCEFSSKSDL